MVAKHINGIFKLLCRDDRERAFTLGSSAMRGLRWTLLILRTILRRIHDAALKYVSSFDLPTGP